MLGGDVYDYHSKLTAKEPLEGVAWEWHQDYDYWYNNGRLFPYMTSAMIAIDPRTRDNGCLQVLRDSHPMGRIDLGLLEGDQVMADSIRTVQLPTKFAERFLGDSVRRLLTRYQCKQG